MHTTKQTKLVRKTPRYTSLQDKIKRVMFVWLQSQDLKTCKKHKNIEIRNYTSCTKKKKIPCCKKINNVGTTAMQEHL
jgi:hypothetical protein